MDINATSNDESEDGIMHNETINEYSDGMSDRVNVAVNEVDTVVDNEHMDELADNGSTVHNNDISSILPDPGPHISPDGTTSIHRFYKRLSDLAKAPANKEN